MSANASKGGRIVVLGSANVDRVVSVSRRPDGGETLTGSDVQRHSGGKGANQAVAARRSGAQVEFVGCLGRDFDGDWILSELEKANVRTGSVARVDRPTGNAAILLTPDGENSIVVSPGANDAVDIALADSALVLIKESDVLVLNLEVPLATVQHAAASAASNGVRVVLNAAPAQLLESQLLRLCDPLVVNEHEARIVLGASSGTSFEDLAADLLAAGAASVVITLGARGAVYADDAGTRMVEAFRVQAIDTTGAGDAFVGTLADELSRGHSLDEAVRQATAAAAISVGAAGAQASYAERSDVDALRQQLGNGRAELS